MIPVDIDELQRDVRALNERVTQLEKEMAIAKTIFANTQKLHEKQQEFNKAIRDVFTDLAQALTK